MKRLLAQFMAFVVQSDRLWPAINATIVRTGRHAERSRRRHLRKERRSVVEAAIPRIVPDLVVRHGTFRGMRYPKEAEHVGGIFPRLLGSFEKELHHVLEDICSRQYSEIVNIGCAEGYYAVGLAIRIPSARVYAFDVDRRKLELCRQMAAANGVADRIVTAGFCDAGTLARIPFTHKGLVLCDCEGYEARLFTRETTHALARCDLLIEVHDCLQPNTSRLLKEHFATTHHLTAVPCVDDWVKANTYDYDELRHYPPRVRRILLGEYRLGPMEWFVLTPRAPLERTEPARRVTLNAFPHQSDTFLEPKLQ